VGGEEEGEEEDQGGDGEGEGEDMSKQGGTHGEAGNEERAGSEAGYQHVAVHEVEPEEGLGRGRKMTREPSLHRDKSVSPISLNSGRAHEEDPFDDLAEVSGIAALERGDVGEGEMMRIELDDVREIDEIDADVDVEMDVEVELDITDALGRMSGSEGSGSEGMEVDTRSGKGLPDAPVRPIILLLVKLTFAEGSGYGGRTSHENCRLTGAKKKFFTARHGDQVRVVKRR
jgi:hypothetical protein